MALIHGGHEQSDGTPGRPYVRSRLAPEIGDRSMAYRPCLSYTSASRDWAAKCAFPYCGN